MDSQTFLTTIGGVYGTGIGSADPTPTTPARSLNGPGGESTSPLELDGGLSLGAGDFSIVGFIRPEFLGTFSNPREVITKGIFDAAATGCFAIIASDTFDRLEVFLSDGVDTYGVVSTTNSLVNNTWIFFAVTYNATTDVLSLELDRGTPTTATSVPSPQDITTDVRISSASTTGWKPFDGQISLIGIWRRILTSGQLDDLYNSGLGKLWSSLAAGTQANCDMYLELDELSTGIAQVDRLDSSGNDNNFTDNGHFASSSEVPV